MKDEIILKYKANYGERVHIFGNIFVENNKHNCNLIINGKETELIEYYDYFLNNNLLEIKLIGFSKVSNMRNMLYECSSLIFISDFSHLQISNITNMRDMFIN